MNKIQNIFFLIFRINRFIILFVLCFSGVGMVFSQGIKEEKIEKLQKVEAEKLFLDRFGNLYSVKDATFNKYNAAGELLYTYSNFLLGPIHSADVGNPMKIMLFYKESAALLFLDDRLAPISESFDLYSKNFTSISLAAYSSNNLIWLLDEARTNLLSLDIFYNERSNIHHNFKPFAPSQIFEADDKTIAIHNQQQGIYFFDSFGTYIKTIAIQTLFDVQIINHTIYYIRENRLHAYNMQTLQEEQFELPIPEVQQCLRYRNLLYLLNKKGEVFVVSL